MITTVAWLEWYLSSLMPCLFSYVLSQWCSQSTEGVLSAVIGVFVCACTFRDTPSPKLGKSSLCVYVCVCPSFIQSLTHFPSLVLFFPFLLPLLSACFLLLSSPSLLPLGLYAFLPGGAEVSVIRARWPPLHVTLPPVHPHLLPGKMGPPPSLAGHRLPFECAASRGSRDLT